MILLLLYLLIYVLLLILYHIILLKFLFNKQREIIPCNLGPENKSHENSHKVDISKHLMVH